MNLKFNIIGGGGFAHEVATWSFSSNIPMFEKPKFYVQRPFADGSTKPLEELDPESRCVIAIGSPLIKYKIEGEAKCEWVSMIHKTAIWRQFNNHVEGLIMCPYSIITDDVVIGKHVTLNLHASVGHDSAIGDFTTLHPGARVSGNCTIGTGCLIGSNAVIREGTYIAPWTIIGAGAVVTHDIKEPGTYVGVPAKRKGDAQV
jgi:sugar O-acyltransferase (sialic acid O-acetyltransferase NeuD family)